jgi:putative hydrolase of the HAD superfamily
VPDSRLCVVFDIDDTLYLERDYVSSGFHAVGCWVAEWLAIPDFQQRCQAAFDSGVRNNIFDRALATCGVEPSSALIQALVELYRTHVPDIRLAADSADALPRISAHWPIAIVSDGPPAAQSAKARALGLHSIASPIVLTGTLGNGVGKPHPRGFGLVETQVKASKFVYIADNPHKDFAGPASLGWATVRIRRPEGLHCESESAADGPNVEFRSFKPLLGFLSKL